jgi:DNA helicase II / ATP-dependent DNA helicase PcrA
METVLNESQQKAVVHTLGPLLIIAGAGTGKTTVITKRIEYLIAGKKIEPHELAALTFTEKAAGEMIERLDTLMPYGYEEPWISTFHGFCDRILRSDGIEIGLSPDYKILSTAKQWILLKKNIFDLGLKYYMPLGNPNKFISALLKFFSRLQDEDATEEEIGVFLKEHKKYGNEVDKEHFEKYKEVFTAYEKYKELKLKENVLDFGDLIIWTMRLFRQRPSVLDGYRKQFKHVLVDEFQDTNFSQLQLIKLLAPPDKKTNLTVVGDDDQAIYAFRGSSVHNILDFKKHYPEAEEVVLTTNYRSGQSILNAAYTSVTQNNPDRLEMMLNIDKKLVAARGNKLPKPLIVEVESLEKEADFVIEKILQLVGKDYTYKDVAILARANSYLDTFVSALRRAGMPYQLIGNRGLFDQDEIRDMLFFLRVASDTSDETSLFYLLHTDVFNINPEEILEVLATAKRTTTPLWEVIKEKAVDDSRFKAIVTYLSSAQKDDTKISVLEILHRFIKESQYINGFLQEDSLENQLKVKNINLFFNRVKEFDTEFPKASICECVEYFDLLLEAGENPAQAEIEDVDTISLLTIHAAKGLEWPIVFLVNMVGDRFPSRNRSDTIQLPDSFVKQDLPSGNAHIQEERRLFYVAITRARDYLFAVHGKDYGGARPKRPSGFLKELKVKTESWEPSGGQLSWLTQLKGVPAPNPRKIIDGKINLGHVSYSQINAYKSCPLRYKYEYVLRVPIQPHHSLSFGTTIHNTLQKFHHFKIKGQDPDLDTLLHIYEKDFQSIGYDSYEHRLKRYEEGQKALKLYFANYKELFPGTTYALERKFKVNINGISLIGRIDRVDKLGKSMELVDYKTGSPKDQKKVDKDDQLTIYAMAAQNLFGEIPQSLSLYFVEAGKKITTVRSEDDINAIKDEISTVTDKMKEGKFEPTPGYACAYCPYNQICSFAEKNRF